MTLGTHDAAFGQIWHLPSAETLSTREFAHLVFEIAGQPNGQLAAMPGLRRNISLPCQV